MLETGGHYGRHYCTPAAMPYHRPHPTDALRLFFRRLLRLDDRPEARRRIIPGMPPETHALGFGEMVYPSGKRPG